MDPYLHIGFRLQYGAFANERSRLWLEVEGASLS